MAILRVSPWDYSAIRKNANDKTEGEFITWVLEKWPYLRDHMYEKIEVVVDWGSGDVPTGDTVPQQEAYVLSMRPIR